MAFSTLVMKALYVGNGVTTAFAAPWLFYDNAHLQVYLVDKVTGVETLQTITTHYTVSGAGVVSGGTVTFLVAPSNAYNVLVRRIAPLTQLVDWKEGDKLPPDTLERSVDLLTMITQQLSESDTRAFHLPIGTSVSNPAFPDISLAANQNLFLRVKADGTGIDAASLSATLTAAAMVAGAIPFGLGAASFDVDAANLFYNNTTNRLGIGTNAPDTLLHVAGDGKVTGKLTLTGALEIAGAIKASSTTPHAIGTSVDTKYEVFIGGSFAPADGGPNAGLVVGPTIAGVATRDSALLMVAGTINEAGSGTHADFASVAVFPPTIGAGAASLTNAAALRVTGAPTGATNNYAVKVDSGLSVFGGHVEVIQNIGSPVHMEILNVNAGVNAYSEFNARNGTGRAVFGLTGTGFTDGSNMAANEGFVVAESTVVGLHLRANANTYIRFSVGVAPAERFRIDYEGGANQTPLMVGVSGGAPLRVSVGANDSGGGGFRVLRVPN